MKSSLSRLGTISSCFLAFSLIAISCSSSGKVQSPQNPKPESSDLVVKTSTKAAIVGGLKALQNKLKYPSKAKQEGIEAILKAQVLVTKTGKVDQISFDENYGYGFEEAARQALRRVEFRAGTRNGEPISMFITIPIKFQL